MARRWRSAVMTGVVVAVAVAAGACDSSPTAPTHYAPFSQTDLRLGGGAEAVNGRLVTVTYTGWFYDASRTEQKGLQFDTSEGHDPFTFTLGAGQVIAGWDLGVVGMKAGGMRRLIIPPSLGYGFSRYGSIPGNTTLLFDIEVLTVEAFPAVTTHPINVTVTAGELASFTAAASGEPAPTVQWQVSTDSGTTWTDVTGATAGTYSFIATIADQGKQFRAVFTNSAGTAATNPATLTVNAGGA